MNAQLRESLKRNRISLRIARAGAGPRGLSLYLWARSSRSRISDAEWGRCVRAMFLGL